MFPKVLPPLLLLSARRALFFSWPFRCARQSLRQLLPFLFFFLLLLSSIFSLFFASDFQIFLARFACAARFHSVGRALIDKRRDKTREAGDCAPGRAVAEPSKRLIWRRRRHEAQSTEHRAARKTNRSREGHTLHLASELRRRRRNFAPRISYQNANAALRLASLRFVHF